MKRIYKRVLALALAFFMIITLLPATSLTAQAEEQGGTAKFKVGSTTYDNLQKAIDATQNSSDKIIVLANDGTITGDYTIPAGVTLLIPYDAAGTCVTNYAAAIEPKEDWSAPSPYRTLTMAEGSSITVQGAISVSARHWPAHGSRTFGMSPYKTYGYVVMEEDSNITVKSGGNLYVYGFISGDGDITAESGASVYENMQITEFRGGTILSQWDVNHGVFPFSQYYAQNIEVPLTLEYGAQEYVFGSAYMQSRVFSMKASFMGASDSLFSIGTGTTITKWYDPATDRLYVEAEGDIALNGMIITMGDESVIKLSIDSKDFVLPINSNISINVKSGSVTMNQDVLLLPGAEVILGENAEFNVTQGCNLYVYDRDQWIRQCSATELGFVFVNHNLVPAIYTPTARYTRTAADLVDAVLDVNGTVNVYGSIYTTVNNNAGTGGASIISSKGTGEIKFYSAAGTKAYTNQVVQTSTISPVAIGIAPAMLKNADGSYTLTKDAVAGTSYAWNNTADGWVKNGQYSIVFNTDGGSKVPTVIADKGAVLEAPAAPTKEGYTFSGWIDDAGNEVAFPMTLTDDTVLTAKWNVNKYKMTFIDGSTTISDGEYEFGKTVQAPAVSKEGYTFTGWTDIAGNKVDFPTTMPAKAMTIKANWKVNEYTLSFVDADGSVIKEITQDYNTAVIAPANPTKEGHTFKYWVDGSGAEAVIPNKMPAESRTYKANWQINQYKITFNTAGAGQVADIVADYGTAITKPADPVKEGYTFLYWMDSNGQQLEEFPDSMPAKNLDLTAKWEIKQVTLSFVDQDGTELGEITNVYGTVVTPPKDPLKEGHRFTGWVDEEGNPAVIPANMPAKDTTLYATWSINQYTITLHLDGGVGSTGTKANYGEPLGPFADPVKDGYEFLGWKDATGNIVELPDTMPAANLEFTASWQINQYTVTFNSNGGTDVKPVTVDYGTKVNAPILPEREGYTFSGWMDEAGNAFTFPIEKMPAANIALTAKWKVNSYTLTFRTYDGVIKSESVLYGTAITAPAAPEREGYTFTGWNQEVPATMPANNLTITAEWEINTYTVAWVYEDGTLLEMDEDVPYGTTHEYNGTNPTKSVEGDTASYIFSGWILSTEPSELADYVYVAKFDKIEAKQFVVQFDFDFGDKAEYVGYAEGAMVVAPEIPAREGYTFAGWIMGGNAVELPMTMPSKNITLTAQWTINQYEMTIDYNNDTMAETTSVDFGDRVYEPETPEKEGYTFEGWADEDGKTVTFPMRMPAKDVTVKAQWSVNTYTITFDTKDGSQILPITQAYGTAIERPDDPQKTGYTFTGWNQDIPDTMPAENLVISANWKVQSFTITYYADGKFFDEHTYTYGEKVVELEDRPTLEGYTFKSWSITLPDTMPAENLVVEALWNINQYTITFDSMGGSDVDSVTADYKTAVGAPTEPVKEGHTFKGWVDEADKAVTFPLTMPAANIALTAKWQINQYTVTFNSNGGTDVKPVTVDYDTKVNAPILPVREGYTFSGWMDEAGNAFVFPIEKMPAANIALTAKWQINDYTITFNTDGGSSVAPIKANYGEAIVAPANPGKTGYTFAGWDTQIPATMPAKNMLINALWNINQYTITFDSMGGSAVASITVDYQATVAAPKAPEKVGYTFEGWTDAAGTKVTFPLTMPVDGMELKAAWKINQYTVTFDTDGGTAIPAVTVDYNSKVDAPAAPEKENYTFMGWVDEAGSPVTFPITVGTENITVKAQWKVHKKIIAWDINDDGTADITNEIDYGTTASVLKDTYAPVASKAADAEYTYVFDGWSPELTDVVTDTIYYARFKSIPNTYTVTIDANGGTLAETSRDCAYNSNVNQPDTPVRDGYKFVGWVDEAGNVLEFPFKMPAKNIVVKASWTLNEYVISWDTDGDTTADDRTTVKHGEKPTHADGVKKADAEYTYTFTGWSPAVTEATKDVTYYAQFKAAPNEYTIKFVDTDGKVFASQKLAYGSAVTVPADPTKEGYTFTEWDSKIPTTMPAEDVTITARWIAKTYVINWDMDGDGKIDDSTDEAYNTIPTHNYIQKPADKKYTYNFIGWDSNKDGKVDGIKPVTGNATYTAVFEAVKIPVTEEIERIWGASRYKTSLAIADELKAELGVSKFSTVIIANGANFPDALAGSYLAAKKDAPILMVDPKGDNSVVLKYITDNLVAKGKVYILGGTAAVPQDVEDSLKAKGYDVERLKGAGRYDTNLEILKEAGVSNEAILVCTGINFADSLSASAAGLPILLVDPGTQKLSDTQIAFLDDAKREIYIIGGAGAVSDTYLAALAKYDSNGTVERVKGKTRYETSVEVAKKFCKNPDYAVVASAQNFPDGLCGGPLAYVMDAPLILTNPTVDASKLASAKTYLADMKIKAGKALGGSGALADDVVRTIFGMGSGDKISGVKYE